MKTKNDLRFFVSIFNIFVSVAISLCFWPAHNKQHIVRTIQSNIPDDTETKSKQDLRAYGIGSRCFCFINVFGVHRVGPAGDFHHHNITEQHPALIGKQASKQTRHETNHNTKKQRDLPVGCRHGVFNF